MKWINTKDQLPPEKVYVLARHNRGTWHDSDDQDNVNCVVVKLIRGISKEDRKPDNNIYTSADEHGNNLVPYCWEQFGPDRFFGQDIDWWQPITNVNEL